MSDWLEILALSTRSRATPFAITLGMLFGVAHLYSTGIRTRQAHLFLVLAVLGAACACLSYGLLLLLMSSVEPAGSDGQGWLRLYVQLCGVWCFILLAVSGVIFRALPATSRSALSGRLLVRSLAIFIPAAMVGFYVATRGKGTW
jgi:hypothetical protein